MGRSEVLLGIAIKRFLEKRYSLFLVLIAVTLVFTIVWETDVQLTVRAALLPVTAESVSSKLHTPHVTAIKEHILDPTPGRSVTVNIKDQRGSELEAKTTNKSFPEERAKSTAYVMREAVYHKVEGQCNTPQGNMVFVKTHKTGSTTLTAILNRYGYTRNLSFVQTSAPGAGHFNYHTPSLSKKYELLPPIGVSRGDFQNYSGYNISAVHIRYSRELMEVLMGNHPTYYITILREPVSQFVSAFRYFDLDKTFLGNSSCRNSEECILEFFTLNKSVFERGPYAWNNQLLDLGMNKLRMHNTSFVLQHIKRLEKELDLVLIMEYFDESLILLKKILCWEYHDILYVTKRVQPFRGDNFSDATRNRIRKHNHADGILYNYFNRTLWKKIADYGPSFESDLATFRDLLSKSLDNCIEGTFVKSLNRGQENIEYILSANATILCSEVIETGRIIRGIRRRQSAKDRAITMDPRTE